MKKKFLVICFSVLLLFNIGGCFNKTESVESQTADIEESNDVDIPSDKEDLNKEENDNKEIAKDDDKLLDVETSQETQNKNIETVQNQSNKPISKKTIVIDPGHGNHSNLEKEKQSPDSDVLKIKDGGGAQGVATGIPEYDINMKVAVKLKRLLEQNNFNVIMTKTTHEESPGNIDRANVGNDNNADLEIRIHCDSSDNQNASGASMLVPEKVGYATAISDVSRRYGEIILNSLVNTCNMKNRGIMPRNDMTGFNWSKVPVVLVEMGFMSNPNEDRMLADNSYQDKLAQGLCDGIVEALK
ncbi:MAG: N-acetylmuramoyl-L-alanine amidase [Romboutsia sp.]|nr:N-acetylmuramoyl-L-alanine amidase [Romboutsia sp.]